MPRADTIANAEMFLQLLEIYVGAGLVVAAVFLVFGIDRVSPGARDSWLFRLLILPGVTGLWPLVLWRWLAREQAGRES